MPVPQPSVLITGASSGIGEACARALDLRGYRVFAGVRRPEDGDRLRASSSDRLTWIELDVAKEDQIARAAGTISDAVGDAGLTGLVNNAGVAVGGPLEFVPLDQVRLQFEINVFGLLAVTQAMLPLLRRRAAVGDRGARIVNIGSIAGRAVSPFAGPYCASKHAVEAFTDGLRFELEPDGFHVSVIEPGVVQTPIWSKALGQASEAATIYPPKALERYGREFKMFGKLLELNATRGVPPNVVAEAVMHALESPKPKTRYLIGSDAKMRARFRRFLSDRANDAILRFFLGRIEKKLA